MDPPSALSALCSHLLFFSPCVLSNLIESQLLGAAPPILQLWAGNANLILLSQRHAADFSYCLLHGAVLTQRSLGVGVCFSRFLWITLWIGWLLVLIQTYNRPTRVPRAFCKTLIPLLILTAFAVALSAIFIHLTYLADCEAPEFGPSHGASVKVNSCPAYGTR